MCKRKFKCYYPKGHEKEGKRIRNVVMTSGGSFLYISKQGYYWNHVLPLHKYVDGGKFNVVWSEENAE